MPGPATAGTRQQAWPSKQPLHSSVCTMWQHAVAERGVQACCMPCSGAFKQSMCSRSRQLLSLTYTLLHRSSVSNAAKSAVEAMASSTLASGSSYSRRTQQCMASTSWILAFKGHAGTLDTGQDAASGVAMQTPLGSTCAKAKTEAEQGNSPAHSGLLQEAYSHTRSG